MKFSTKLDHNIEGIIVWFFCFTSSPILTKGWFLQGIFESPELNPMNSFWSNI